MKLCTFDLSDGSRHIGAVIDDQHLADFTSGSPDPMFRDMLALIDAGDAGLAAARQLVQSASVVRKIAEVRYAAALPQPRQMRDFLCFEKHFRQARANRYLFAGANSAAAARSPGAPFSTADTERDPAKVEIPAIWYQEPIYYKCNRFSVVGTDTDVINPRYCKMLDYELEFAAVLGKGGVNIRKEQAAEHIYGYCIFNDFSARDQQMREMSGSLGPS
ncbi:MAG: hypothetical protein RL657_2385, partial [Pseudomonadota bacterium]